MTIEEIEKSNKIVLCPSDIAEILQVKPYSINVQAQQDYDRGINSFPFDVFKIGTRVKISRLSFLNFVKGSFKNEK